MKEFKTFHPIVNFTYFVFVIGFSCTFMNPAYLCISVICAFVYSVILKGEKAIKTNFIYMIPTLIITALVNPAFNHEGITILTYLPSGNPLTLESLIYGLCAAVMLISVICWFSCYTEIMTSDKFIYLFGKIIPSLSLVISMTLRFIPKFTSQLKTVVNAQRCMGIDISNGSIITRAKNGIKILSVMATWSLENAIETADSMKSRGYGISGRTSFSIFSFDKRDKITLSVILFFGIYLLFCYIFGQIDFQFFPYIKSSGISALSIGMFIAYFLLCTFPIIIEIKEAIKWKALKSKI